MGFRDSILNIAPPWLLDKVGGALLYTGGLVLDVVNDAWLKEGIKARFPDTAPDDALGYIGNDRQIDRGPAEGSAAYAVRLRRAIDTWRNAGGGRTILAELAAYFTNVATPGLRLVSDSSVWHEYDWTTGLSTRTKVTPANWIWDSFTGTRWQRGWVIIDSTLGPWTQWLWGDPAAGLWGSSGRMWGSSATPSDVDSVIRIVKKWKPANVNALYVIVVFSNAIFRRTDTAPPNPNGDYDVPANRDNRAIYWPGGA